VTVLDRNEKGAALMGTDASGQLTNFQVNPDGSSLGYNAPMTTPHTWVQLVRVDFTSAYDTGSLFTAHTFQYVVANVDSDVVVRAEGSLDGTNWFNLDTGDTTHASDGVYFLPFVNVALRYVRFGIITEHADPSPVTVDASYMGC